MTHIGLWLILALMWSSSFAAIKVGIETIDSMPLVAGRMLIGALVLLIALKMRGMSLYRVIRTWIRALDLWMVKTVLNMEADIYEEAVEQSR